MGEPFQGCTDAFKVISLKFGRKYERERREEGREGDDFLQPLSILPRYFRLQTYTCQIHLGFLVIHHKSIFNCYCSKREGFGGRKGRVRGAGGFPEEELSSLSIQVDNGEIASVTNRELSLTLTPGDLPLLVASHLSLVWRARPKYFEFSQSRMLLSWICHEFIPTFFSGRPKISLLIALILKITSLRQNQLYSLFPCVWVMKVEFWFWEYHSLLTKRMDFHA